LKKIIVVLFTLFMVGCANNQIIEYAETRYPNCNIEHIDSNSISTKLRITCPNKEPFEKIYRSQ